MHCTPSPQPYHFLRLNIRTGCLQMLEHSSKSPWDYHEEFRRWATTLNQIIEDLHTTRMEASLLINYERPRSHSQDFWLEQNTPTIKLILLMCTIQWHWAHFTYLSPPIVIQNYSSAPIKPQDLISPPASALSNRYSNLFLSFTLPDSILREFKQLLWMIFSWLIHIEPHIRQSSNPSHVYTVVSLFIDTGFKPCFTAFLVCYWVLPVQIVNAAFQECAPKSECSLTQPYGLTLAGIYFESSAP